MSNEVWRLALAAALSFNAAAGLGYRVYRLAKGGPLADLIGQAILAGLLAALAAAALTGAGWARWAAFFYALLFGVVVMPVWVLGVLIPLRPRWPDYSFTVLYWGGLVGTAVAAVAA